MTIQWYPGHIAKAEKALREQLKRVDVVLEVRDARIPRVTAHPRLREWIGDKSRVLVLNRMDAIAPSFLQAWSAWFQAQDETPHFTNAQQGKGIQPVARAAQAAGTAMNQRRRDRGLLPRPVRAVVIGFPNVGKSALINRLLKRKVVDSARRPGVTRQLRWVRVSKQLELLDAPGVLPSKLEDQQAAMKLAICDDIGEAAYDNQRVAAGLIDLLKQLEKEAQFLNASNQTLKLFLAGVRSRYDLDPHPLAGDAYLLALANQRHQGNIERTARQLLNDFRKGLLGAMALELPPSLLTTPVPPTSRSTPIDVSP